jgi:L,D-peptidoglycan transpeptidase YkuD (ErfK/YbiS/YcfS/YnhG family)
MALLRVHPEGYATFGRWTFACALGRAGIVSTKTEGDGGTPVGLFPLRRLFYRHDRLGRPRTPIPATPVQLHQGWCDDPESPHYNRAVTLPSRFGHERLWRADGLYDLILTIGHNDRPVRPSAGSAVFVHVAHPAMTPTEGCVAFAKEDLLHLLRVLRPGDAVRIQPH